MFRQVSRQPGYAVEVGIITGEVSARPRFSRSIAFRIVRDGDDSGTRGTFPIRGRHVGRAFLPDIR